MVPITPFWFKQRQCKAEPAGSDSMLKVSGPILPVAYLYIAPEKDHWARAGLRLTADGPDVSGIDGCPNANLAWEAAFELYRTHVIA